MDVSIRSRRGAPPLGDDCAVSQFGDCGSSDEELVPEQRCDVSVDRRRMSAAERCAEDAGIDRAASRGDSSGEGVGLFVS